MMKIFLTPAFLLLTLLFARAQDPVFTSPGQYGQTYISYSLSDNIFYSAPERFRVTSSVQNSNVGKLFDQDYNNPAITVSATQSTIITIDLKGKGGNALTNAGGYIYLNFFEEHHPDSIYTRLYDSTNEFADFEWEEWTNASTTSPYLLYRLHVPGWVEKPSKIELKIFAHASVSLILTEIEYYQEFPGQYEKGLVNKFNNNTLWKDLLFYDTANVKRASIKNDGTAFFNGNVGIGTSNISDTSYKLFVNGSIRTKKLKVSQSGWPDYVFDKNYVLPSLKVLECFVKANHHLPGIVSASEVAREGLDVGDNQATLLQKIEELTLYLIDQNKKLEKQTIIIKQQHSDIRKIKKQLQKVKVN
jgi:hypothetical protein